MAGTDFNRPELDPSTDPLWQRLEAYDLDDIDAALKFSDRLARENGWKPDYARRVIEEYKRFCYLALRAGHEVAPSDQVDQAWHLHLNYSRNYWDEFCAKTLQADLHHDPTPGGEAEAEKFQDTYQETLASYQRVSGERPPQDIWPSPLVRFASVDTMRRIDVSDSIIVRKPSRGMLWVAQIAAVFGILFSIWNELGYWGWFFAILAVALNIYRSRNDNRGPARLPHRDGDAGGGCIGG